MLRRLVLALLLAPAVLAACGGGDRVEVAAAANLRDVFEAMRPGMEEACGCEVAFVFGSSGLLSEQVASGAPYAMFFSADEGFVTALAAAGHVRPESVTPYARGRLALAWREGIEPVRTIEALARDDVGRIALANPSHAPYGRAAREALERAGLWDALQERVVYGENVRQATDYVASGNADAGLLPLALVLPSDLPHEELPAEAYPPIVQAVGIVAGRDEEAARAILDHVLGPEGRRLLEQFGYGVEP